jgi:hypothetical protein
MKLHVLLAIGLAIGLIVSTFAQQKEPSLSEQDRALGARKGHERLVGAQANRPGRAPGGRGRDSRGVAGSRCRGSSDLMVVTKIDLLPYVDFDCNACIHYAKRLKPSVEMIKTSAKSGEGLSQWYDWLCAVAVPVSR